MKKKYIFAFLVTASILLFNCSKTNIEFNNLTGKYLDLSTKKTQRVILNLNKNYSFSILLGNKTVRQGTFKLENKVLVLQYSNKITRYKIIHLDNYYLRLKKQHSRHITTFRKLK